MGEILTKNNYSRQFVKTGCDNEIAINILNKYGFQEYAQENQVVYLQRYT